MSSARRIDRNESEEYFKTRPRESQIGAWASHQSDKIGSRKELEENFNQIKSRYEGKEVPLPDFWGGFIVEPDYFEFWQGRPNRLHDRLVYKLENNKWELGRLSP